MIPVYHLAKNNKITQAATILLYVLTILVTQFMWRHGGLYDESVLAYPCILIMAAMVGDKSLFINLLVVISASIGLNGLVNSQSWYINSSSTISLGNTFLVLITIYLISYIIWIMVEDFRELVNKLNIENSNVIKSKQEIENLLHHDLLTGLPNKIMAKELFAKARSNTDSSKNIYLMFLDLDNFKVINDALGHQAGDALLIELSQRMFQLLQTRDSVCRYIGDEFVVIVESTESEEYVASLAQQIIEQISKPFYYLSNEFICGCSIGISTTATDGEDFDTLLKHADAAMYYSKSQGGNSFHFYNKEMNIHGHEYISVVSDLRKAIVQDELVLTYQPKIDIQNNKIIGAEALIRWQHPEKGLIYPDEFIPQAEKSGLIIEIGDWVLSAACRQCKQWLNSGYSDFTMAVNVSSKQFAKKDFYTKVEKTLSEYQLNASSLELEMTESLLIDNSDELKSTLKNLHDLGVHLSIDDFGTGYSNLGYLKAFDIEYLKIDRSFISDLVTNPKNKTLVKAIVQMSHGLEIQNIAEGVEDQKTVRVLQQLQCEIGQGYYWSKPIFAEQFEVFAAEYNK
ncbi:EAL domain-containing protein [Psychrosphaera sp. F3M07]|uniref:putative bifunctional diguanylate cyclase/phosphodiesterase n=1 Tax=Psychrosphaera sp. F3M07 TaxID=2841560 RepID=UPI001C084BA6|nr:EAL domain-containing protein [Psychrosphaera sp. F3M07]MBU2917649.1 EAL domain-containing protein [Psychrosphaera sp. F3M07]